MLSTDKLIGKELNLDKKYTVLSLLGEGGFSKVYRARDGQKNTYAVKVINSEDRGIPCLMEASIMATYRHPNLNHAINMLVIEDNLYIIQEEAICDLHDYAVDHPPTRSDCIKILHDIGQAVAFLHREDIIHGDIKSGNILVFGNVSSTASRDTHPVTSVSNKPKLTYKLTDFNLSCNKNWKRNLSVCTASYRPIEAWEAIIQDEDDYSAAITGASKETNDSRGDTWDESVDIWCLGITIYNSLFHIRLFTSPKSDDKPGGYLNALYQWEDRWYEEQKKKNSDKSTQLRKPDRQTFTTSYIRPQVKPEVFNDDALHRLIVSMLAPKKSYRPTITQIMNNKLFVKYSMRSGNISKLSPLKISNKTINMMPKLSPLPKHIVIDRKYSKSTMDTYCKSYYVLKIANDIYSRYKKHMKDDEELVRTTIQIMAMKIANEKEISLKKFDNLRQIFRIERDICRSLNFMLH